MIKNGIRPPGLERLTDFTLASASPRRLELLRHIGLEPRVIPPHVDESQRPGETPSAYVERMAHTKATAGWLAAGAICLGADTVVTMDGAIFGKPATIQEAQHTLKRLAGRNHQVLTSVAVAAGQAGTIRHLTSVTSVWMKAATESEITAYVATGEPMDKAGSYGIQGLGSFLVTRIDGSYTGVVGLPLFETVILLQWADGLVRS
ncbi:MAG: septum formation inhibitor Maf [Magnetococcales bacterium]|nr:septum formation inhibitor Maf [Magnetococcales bacterium]